MVQLHAVSDREQVVDTMIGLTRVSSLHRVIVAGSGSCLHRVIVAGSGSMELHLALRQRGFIRVATAATCRIPRGHTVGLIAGHNSLQAIEGALAEVSQFLGASAAIAVLIDCRESGAGMRIRGKLEEMGFRIEAGVRCQQGFVLSAIRQGFGQMENAA